MNNTFEFIWANKLRFLGIFFIVFTISYIFMVAIDFLPEPVDENESEIVDPVSQMAITSDTEEVITMQDEVEPEADQLGVDTTTPAYTDNDLEEESNVIEPEVLGTVDIASTNTGIVKPTSINIPKINKTITVLNPASRTIADLDAALLNGVVRHPDSATLNQEGNVFILGHSSYLPNVFNKNFQAFNGIQNLAWGDKIEVSADGVIYEYRVERVYKADAQDTTVPIAGDGYKLTLATCNSFGSVDDRYIVEAKRVGVTPS